MLVVGIHHILHPKDSWNVFMIWKKQHIQLLDHVVKTHIQVLTHVIIIGRQRLKIAQPLISGWYVYVIHNDFSSFRFFSFLPKNLNFYVICKAWKLVLDWQWRLCGKGKRYVWIEFYWFFEFNWIPTYIMIPFQWMMMETLLLYTSQISWIIQEGHIQ